MSDKQDGKDASSWFEPLRGSPPGGLAVPKEMRNPAYVDAALAVIVMPVQLCTSTNFSSALKNPPPVLAVMKPGALSDGTMAQ